MSLKAFQAELQNLADKVDQEWAALGYDQAKFPELATCSLKTFESDNVPTLEICLNEMGDITLPPQHFLHGEFSDFPLTLVRKENFFLDIYIWYRSDTNIHSHHFCGAFKVIAGKSVQIRYTSSLIKEIGPGLSEVDIIQGGMDFLNLNTVHQIDPHDKFIHNVIHTGKPTITLCLRTPSFKGEALDVFIYPKYKLSATLPTQPMQKWLQATKLSLSHGITPGNIPFSDIDIVRMIYRNFLRQIQLDIKILELLQDQLTKNNVAVDFQTVLAEQHKFYAKLKTLAGM